MIDRNALEKILKSEGRKLNPKEPASVGGKSFAGISQKAYSSWLMKKCKIKDAPTEVDDLTGRDDVIFAFYEDYFVPACVDLLPPCLQYLHMDFFTNSYSHANRIVQRLLGFEGKEVDGVLGRGSKAKLKEFTEKFLIEKQSDPHLDDELIMHYHDMKLDHYESIKEKNEELYNENIRGWRKRAQHVLAELSEYFEDEEPTTSAVHDDEHIDPFADDVDSDHDIHTSDPERSQRDEETEQRLATLEDLMKGVAEKLSVLDTLTDKISVISDLQEKVDSISNPIDAASAKKIKKGFFG